MADQSLKRRRAEAAATTPLRYLTDLPLVRMPERWAICLSQEDFTAEMKRMKHPYGFDGHEWLDESQAACVYTVGHATDPLSSFILVCIRPRTDGDHAALMATFVHESVHVCQQFMEIIGETEPSKEFQAYATENIFRAMAESYSMQIDLHGKRRKAKK